MKKILSVMLTFCISCAAWADIYREGNVAFTYTVKGKNVTITGGGFVDGYEEEAVFAIPATIDGRAVTAIAERAFERDNYSESGSYAQKVVIPEGVTSVGKYAFRGWYGGELILPKTLKTIGDYAFADTDFYTVTIPEGVTSIGKYAFSGEHYDSFVEVPTLPSTLKTIGEGAFSSGYLGYYSRASYDEEEEWTLTIPKGVTSIGTKAFAGTQWDFVVEAGNTKYKSDSGALYSKDGKTLLAAPGNSGGEDFTVLSTVTKINDYAFAYTDFGKVTLPEKLTTIGAYAFYSAGAASLDLPETVTTIGAHAFSGFGFYDGTFTIPAKVTSIGDGAFASWSFMDALDIDPANKKYKIEDGVLYTKDGKTLLTLIDSEKTSFEIPETVTAIGASAFSGSDITSITIPSKVKTIGDNAFEGCYELASVQFPASLTTIGVGAFAMCGSLQSIELPSKLTSIGEEAFYECWSLSSVTLPDSLKTIGPWAFCCTNLCSITIPKGVTTIGEGAFYWCYGMESIDVATANTKFRSINGALYSKDGKTLVYVPCVWDQGESDVSLDIPSGVTAIGDYALADWWGDAISLPATLTTIGDYAFGYYGECVVTIPKNVTSLGVGSLRCIMATFKGDVPSGFFGAHLYEGCVVGYPSTYAENWEKVLPEGDYEVEDVEKVMRALEVTVKGKNATITGLKETLEGDIEIPEKVNGKTVTAIADGAFEGNTTITSFTLPEGVTSIGARAFAGCIAERIVLPSTLTKMGDAAFAGSALTSVTLPSKTTAIGNYAFENCLNLQSVTLPSTLTKIDNYAFSGCENLSTITIPSKVSTIGIGAFMESGLSFIDLSSTAVKTLETAVFAGCADLQYVMLPTSLTKIGDLAFAESALMEITLTSKVTSIGEGAFSGCPNISEIAVDSKNTKYQSLNGALYSKDGKSLLFVPMSTEGTFEVPAGVTKICDWAFYGCSVDEVLLPSTLTTIGAGAFEECRNLTSIIIPKSVKTVGEDAFSSLYTVTFKGDVPKGYADSGLANATVWYPSTYKLNWKTAANTSGLNASSYDVEENLWDWDYEIIGGKAIIYYYWGSDSHVDVPEKLEGYPVKEIAEWAFDEDCGVQSITLPEGLTTIGDDAFEDCSSLTSVQLPSTLTSIGDCAFSGTGLTSITIPAKVSTIGGAAFAAEHLTTISVVASNAKFSVINGALYSKDGKTLVAVPGGFVGDFTIPSGVTTIGCGACNGINGLTGVEIPTTVTTIGDGAFEGIDNAAFTSISIPKSVTTIQGSAFANCLYLEVIDVDAANKKFKSVDGVLYSKDGKTLVAVPARYYNEAFFVDGVYTFVVPNGVTTIADGAFEGHGGAVFDITENDFRFWFEFAVDLPSTLTKIGEFAFMWSTLTSIDIPAKVTSIGKWAFVDCKSLTEVTLPDNLTIINEMMFSGCYSLQSIKLPAKLKTIGAYAFEFCFSLSEIEFPATLTKIDEGAFDECRSLRWVVFNGNVPTVYNDCFLYMQWHDGYIDGEVPQKYAKQWAKVLNEEAYWDWLEDADLW